MAFVDGDYTISMADGKLILTYTLSVRYGVDGAAEVTEKIYNSTPRPASGLRSECFT